MQPVWDIRQDPVVCAPFEKIWGCAKEDLLVSFDGFNICFPPEQNDDFGWYDVDRTDSSWLHTDQRPEKKGLHCIQGLLNLRKVNKGDSTLSVLVGSHNYHEEFFETTGNRTRGDWYKLRSDEERQFYIDRGCEQVCVEADEGSMIFWDSRTIHQGIAPSYGRAEANTRVAVYVCMMPRRVASLESLRIKRDAFRSLKMTNHWANEIVCFDDMPDAITRFGKPMPDLAPAIEPKLTPLGLKLAGFDDEHSIEAPEPRHVRPVVFSGRPSYPSRGRGGWGRK
jgi:hypothetical protein